MKKPEKIHESKTNLYSVSKTLRFKLKPIGETEITFDSSKIRDEDEKRNVAYQEVKKMMDVLHRNFINDTLNSIRLNSDLLEKYIGLFQIKDKDEKQKKDLTDTQSKLRKEIHLKFTEEGLYKHLFDKEVLQLLKDDIERIRNDKHISLSPNDALDCINQFDKFTTYFRGFFENRKNMYSHDEIHTSVTHRIVNENIPIFLQNQNTFQKLNSKYPEILSKFEEKQFKQILDKFKMDTYPPLASIFENDSINRILDQNGIDFYNAILGAYKEDNKIKSIIGLNQLINQECHQTGDKTIGKLSKLKKQILSDIGSISTRPEPFVTDSDMYVAVAKFYEISRDSFSNLERVISSLAEGQLPTEGVYVKAGKGITSLSQKWLGSWNEIKRCFEAYYRANDPKPMKDEEKYAEKIEKEWKSKKSISVTDLNAYVQQEYLNETFENFLTEKLYIKIAVAELESAYNAYTASITSYPQNFRNDKKAVAKLKVFLDGALSIFNGVEYLKGKGEEFDRNTLFYGDFNDAIQEIEDVLFPVYNKTRNYVTQKPYSIQKFKLNFQCPTFLNGWDLNKESSYLGTLLLKEGGYYLAILHKDHKKALEKAPTGDSANSYQKMIYKYLPGPNKMIPKVFFSEKNKADFPYEKELKAAYENKTHIKSNDNFNLADCHRLIDFFKKCLQNYENWQTFHFKFSDTKTYEDISQFYNEVALQGYKMSFQDLPEDYIHKLVKDGKLYLFQLYNKDFSKHSTGNPNLHTLYWKSLFTPQNLQDVCMKLSGEAELFFRPASLPKKGKATHPANLPIPTKKPQNQQRQSLFTHDIIKDKRFIEDHFQLHIPIASNFKSEGISEKTQNINYRNSVKDNPEVCIIGIDRGESHLLYVNIIDRNGKIFYQETLNIIEQQDYKNLLEDKAKERQQGRLNWTSIEGIKDLKAGYLSLVIHKITQLMIHHNAIVVLEDLNLGFKQGRQKIERQIYQKFEKMLIDKLNFLVEKEKAKKEIEGNPDEPGGIRRAYQLTNQFTSFQKMGKQNGALFYTPPQYTSVIDPTTGFVPVFKFKYKKIEEAQKILEGFTRFEYKKSPDPKTSPNRFEIDIDFAKLTSMFPYPYTLAIEDGTERHVYNPKSKGKSDVPVHIPIRLDEKLKSLLAGANIEFASGENLMPDILRKNEKRFLEELFYILRVQTQLRYKNSAAKDENDRDYILSPVINAKNHSFDSRKKVNELPENGDSNGAYHIALKGLLLLDRFDNAEDLEKVSLAISNSEWFEFAAKHARRRMNG